MLMCAVRTYPQEVKEFAWKLYQAGYKPKQIKEEIKKKFGYDVDSRVISNWISRMKKKLQAQQQLAKVAPDIVKEIEKLTEEKKDITQIIEEKKEELKKAANKSQTKPSTAVERILNKEIVEEATERVSEYIALGKELIQRLEEKAKKYGFSSVAEYIMFLDDFYEKHKYDAEKYQELLDRYKKLKKKYAILKLIVSEDFKNFIRNVLYELRKKEILALSFLTHNDFE